MVPSTPGRTEQILVGGTGTGFDPQIFGTVGGHALMDWLEQDDCGSSIVVAEIDESGALLNSARYPASEPLVNVREAARRQFSRAK